MAKRPVRQCRQSFLKLDYSVSIAEALAERKRRMLTESKKEVKEACGNPKDEGMNTQEVVTETKPKKAVKKAAKKSKTKRKEWQTEHVDDKIARLREKLQEQVLCPYHRIREPYKYIKFLERRIESLEDNVDSFLAIISEVNPVLWEMLL